MTSDKKNVSLLADIFVKAGLTDIVISPGSRNAPIIISFVNNSKINAFSIIDERSAAFFALGLALNSKKTVAIACTSGSAILNYASAISEAYYQKIPLLVITADRPPYLIDVGDGQTIKQNNVYANFIKKSYQLPLNINDESDRKYTENIINEAINSCVEPQCGPVHINIPFDEPIYGVTNNHIQSMFSKAAKNVTACSALQMQKIAEQWNNCKKIIVIAGQTPPNIEINQVIEAISQYKNVVVIAETTSNLYGDAIIGTIDNVVSTICVQEVEAFKPDMLISFGGQIVSKMIKKFLRNNKPGIHYHISPSNQPLDTYFCLTDVLVSDEYLFFSSLLSYISPINSNYASLWHTRKNEIDKKRDAYLSTIEYSDFKVIDNVLAQLPEDSVLHLGNSTPVRYSQLFGSKKNTMYCSNRGVSGIDGQVSTAVGFAYASNKLNVLITGDLGFLYDSNGLMNNYLRPNLKIIVINNSGGGIFRFISGPDTTPNLEEFFVAKHSWKAEYICKAFNVKYISVDNISDLELVLQTFFTIQSQTAEVLEITTPSNRNASILRQYFKFIKE